MKKNILITGGGGFIGTNLTLELLKRGHNVLVSDIYNSHQENFVRCDVKYLRQIQNLFSNYGPFDFVYHLAAEYGRWNGESYFENLWLTNVVGTKNILKMQEENNFKLIFFSSAEVYGDFQGIMNEDVMINNPICDTYQINDYAISKWAGELMCNNSSKMFNTKTVIVRPVNCYGPHEHYTPYRGFIPKFIYSALNKKKYTVYLGHRRIIDYVEDTCVTISNIIDNFKEGEAYNIGGKIEWENDIKSYSDMILKAVDSNESIVIYKKSEKQTTKNKKMDFNKSIIDLDHNPKIDPEKGINLTVNWMKKYYKID